MLLFVLRHFSTVTVCESLPKILELIIDYDVCFSTEHCKKNSSCVLFSRTPPSASKVGRVI